MADVTPGGRPVSFGGTTLASLTSVADFSVPNIDKQPIEAYESLIGLRLPVDLLNGTPAPRKDIFTCTILVRADDAVTNPVTAYQNVMAGYRLLEGLPETGTLVVYSDTSNTGTVSCQARRKPIPFMPTPSNSRHYIATLTFTLTSPWS